MISAYHAHVYYSVATRASALALREAISREFGKELTLHSPADGPRGPHVHPMFGMDIPLPQFTAVLSFLVLQHGPHSILFHPVTGNELRDHTHHALWLGPSQPLDLGVL